MDHPVCIFGQESPHSADWLLTGTRKDGSLLFIYVCEDEVSTARALLRQNRCTKVNEPKKLVRPKPASG